MNLRKILSLLVAMTMLFSCVGITAMAEGTAVAKVGNTEYATIDEAIGAWTNGTTLTLLSDVTLSNVIKLSSTEYHILDLGTYTITAASGKNAIEITCEGLSNATYALTVNADASNPGGITATGKACIYYNKTGSTKDRPIIVINGGVYNGSYSINSVSNGNTNCPQFRLNGGTFNGNVNLTKNMLWVSGGTFNGWVNCTGDSSAYRQISGGTFKQWQFMTADADSKFWVGTSKANYNVGVYVDDNGYLVVGGPVVTEPDETFAASSANYGGWSSYLKYSSAATNGLYYTSVEEAFADNNKATGSVTVYVDELDMTDINYKGTIVVPEGEEITIIVEEGVTPTWTVNASDDAVTYTDNEGNALEKDESGAFVESAPAEKTVATVDGVSYTDIQEAIKAAAPDGTVELLADVTVDTWYMMTEKTISTNQLITLVIDGLVINGNDNTLTINSVESASNGGYLFDDARNLSIQDLTIEYPNNGGGIGLKSGTISNVTINGGNGIYPGAGGVTITGCNFNTTGDAIYYEDVRENIVITGNTFNVAEDSNVVILRSNEQFTDNTVVSGRTVNVAKTSSATVRGNDFGNVRFKVYNEANAIIEDNEINVLAFNDDSKVKSTFGENVLSEAAQTVLDAADFDGTTGLTGSGTAEDPYIVNDIEDLKWFRDDVNSGNDYSGKYVKLASDIDLNDEEWTPIAYNGKTFKGNFDGGNKTVKNLKITKELVNSSVNNCIGFFGRTDSPAVICNLTIENVGITGSLYVGAVVGLGYTGNKIENCTVKGDIAIDAWWYAGVIGGNGYMNLVNNCHVIGNDNSYIEGNDGSYIGGIWGFRGENAQKTTNCTVTNLSITGVDRVGGISGIAHYGNIISDCSAKDVTITATDPDATTVGLIAGACQGTKSEPSVFEGNTVENVTAKAGNSVVTGFYGTNIDGSVPVTNYIAEVNGVAYETLQAAVDAAKAGDTITLIADATLAENVTLPAGVTLNGNGKTINGEVWAGGNLTFVGHTKVASFNAGYDKPVITIGEGACLEIIGTGRVVIGHGATFNITGSIDNAKTADTTSITPSLIIPGASFTGAGVNFNVTNAYIKTTASYCSSSKSASGTFDFNIKNSIWEQFGKLAFESQSTAATVNFDLKDSVLTTTSHLVFGVSKGEIVIDNSNVNVGKSNQIENQSTMTIKNGSVVNGAVATSSNAKNPGTIIVEDATYAVIGEFSGSDLGTGTLIIKKGATVSSDSITKANIVIDAAGMKAGDEINLNAKLDKFAGTLSVINNAFEAKIVDDKIVLVAKPVAKIGETTYATLEEAFKAATANCTIEILADVTIDYKWDCRDYATNGSHSQFKEYVTINGNNHTIKFTGTISDGNWNTIFRFEENAIVKDLTIDISEATGAQRVITAKKSLDVDNLTIVGSAKYGIIFGEGATVEDLADAEISIANSNLNGTRRAISDNEGGKDVKSVTVKGNTLNANVCVSAFETATFTDNTVTDGYVDIRSYTANNTLDVTATGNTLTENTDTNYNYIKAGGTVNAQEGFVLPWDGVTISNLDELKMFRDAVNAGDTYEGKTVYLNADIDLEGENWTPIGAIYNEHGFMGNFDGQNHKIMNLTINNPELDSDGYAYAGLFGVTEGIDKDNQNFIKNLTIENVTINTTGHIVAAAIAYPYYTIVDNVKVCGKISISGGNYTAGVLAYTRRCINASNLFVEGDTDSTISGKQVVGGVISDIQMNGGLTADYSNFNVSGVVISGIKNVGGISGIISEQKLIEGSVKDVTLSCDDARVGIVSGSLGGASVISNVTIDNVTGASSIVGADYDTGKVVETKIGDKYYKTLADALKANVEGEITLLAPIVVVAGETLKLDKDVTITYTSNVAGEDMITNRGNLVIDGATLVYTNTDTTANNVTVSTISCEPGSTLEIKSGTVQNDSTNNGADGIYAYAIDLVTNGNLGDVTATISGGNVISSNYMAIRQFVNGESSENTLTVAGGTIKGATRGINIQLKNNMAYTTISGGKIIGGDYSICFLTTSENVSVTGGEFEGDVWYSGTEGFISGGTFSVKPDDAYAEEGHVFEKNAEGKYSVVEKADLFEFYGASPILGNSLAIDFYVAKTNLSGEGYYAEIEHDTAEGIVKTTIPVESWSVDSKNNYYIIRYSDITAKQITETLNITIYDANGSQVSVKREDGVKAYAERMLAKADTSDKLRTTLVDLLNYGAAAQKQFAYRIDMLANAELTDEQKAYASDMPELVDERVIETDKCAGSSLVLKDNIKLDVYFAGITEDMRAEVTYTKHSDTEPKTYTYSYSDLETNGNYKVLTVNSLVIADAKQTVTITVYNADGSVYTTYKDSMNSYLARQLAKGEAESGIYTMTAKFTASSYNFLH